MIDHPAFFLGNDRLPYDIDDAYGEVSSQMKLPKCLRDAIRSAVQEEVYALLSSLEIVEVS